MIDQLYRSVPNQLPFTFAKGGTSVFKKKYLPYLTTLALLAALAFVLLGSGGQAATAARSGAEPLRHTASLQFFTLSDMTANADKIFRGTVIDFNPTTVAAGGAELPAVTYHLRVEQSFKGEFPTKDDVQYLEITMVGSIKAAPAQGSLKQLSALPAPPRLEVGGDYLLMTTAQSPIGLSTTVGLGQGSFQIYTLDKQEWAKNEFNNAGLFDGPVAYDELAAQIQQLVGE
jgi:hypothetical protein